MGRGGGRGGSVGGLGESGRGGGDDTGDQKKIREHNAPNTHTPSLYMPVHL